MGYIPPMDVKILGQTYAIKSKQDPQFTNEVASYVEARMKELSQKLGPVGHERLAVLTAMNMAGELLNLKKSLESSQHVLSKQVQELIHDVDQVLNQLV